MPKIPSPKEALQNLKAYVQRTPIWRSMFRHDYKDTPRNRALMIIGNIWLHLHPVKVRKHALNILYTLGMGGISFWLFLMLVGTGVLLMFYYRPVVEHAYKDIKDLLYVVPFGVVLRNVHRWAGELMVLTVILHMAWVFYRKGYRVPREFNWCIGVICLVLTLMLSFTGYLLPWDQIAIWAITIGGNMAAATPILGSEGPFSIVSLTNDARYWLLGGKTVGQNALLRFYVWHCVGFPFLLSTFLMVHFWRVRKDGFSGPPVKAGEDDKVYTWPHLVKREFLAALLVTVLLLVWAFFIMPPLEDEANPNKTPNPAKAPWYFVGLQEMLVYFDPWVAGVLLPTLIILGLMAIPYIDRGPKGEGVLFDWKNRPFAMGFFTYGMVMWFLLIAIGQFFRGPGWFWFWPWQEWTIHRVTTLKLHNLPNWLGIAGAAGYFGIGMTAPRFLFKKFYEDLGPLKYAVAMAFILLAFMLPIKIFLRLWFNVKYIVATPWFNI